MISWHLGLLLIATRDLNGLVGQIFVSVSQFGDAPLSDAYHRETKRVLSQLKRVTDDLYVSHLMRTKIERAAAGFEDSSLSTNRTTAEALKQLHEDLIVESMAYVYLMLPNESKSLFESESPFGDDVDAAFPDARIDVREGTRCLLLNRWTAAVFHLLRAAELVLRALAERMGVENVGQKDFGQLIQESRAKHDQIGSRDPAKQFSADALASLDLFKDAWRNPPVHSRDHYDGQRAWDVWNGVRAFMQSMSRANS